MPASLRAALGAFALLCLMALPAAADPFWKPIGPYGHGLAQLFAFAPSRPEIVYAATLFGGGIRRSADGGKTWLPANGDLDLNTRSVTQLTVDPKRPDAVYALIDGGLFRTLDGGTTWVSLLAMSAGTPGAQAFALSPADSSLLFAGRAGQVLRSRDGGATWERLTAGLPDRYRFDVLALAVDPHHPRHVFASLGGRIGGIFESFNSGDFWINRSSLRASRLLFDRDGTLYAFGNFQVQRSRDNRAEWKTVLNFFGIADFALGGGGGGRPSTLWASAENTLLRSDDQGDHWTETAVPPTANIATEPSPLGAAPGPSGILLTGTPNEGVFRRIGDGPWRRVPGFGFQVIGALGRASGALLAGGSGLFRSTNDGASWTAVRPDLAVSVLTVDPVDPRTVYAGTSVFSVTEGNIPLWKSTDAGVTWSPLQQGLPTFNDVTSLAIDPVHPQILFLTTDASAFGEPALSGLYQSSDGGETWSRHAVDGCLLPSRIVIPTNEPGVIYVTCGSSIRRSVDGGSTWALLLDGTAPGVDSNTIDVLAVSPSDPRVLYAAESAAFHRPDVLVWTSTDHGATWTAQPTQPFDVTALAIDPQDSGTVYLSIRYGYGGAVWRSRAGGPWEPEAHRLPGLDVYTLTFDPATPGRLLAGTSLGVFERMP